MGAAWRLRGAALRRRGGGVEVALWLSAAAWGRRGGCMGAVWGRCEGGVGAECSGVEAAWRLHRDGVGVQWRRGGATWRRHRGGVEAAWRLSAAALLLRGGEWGRRASGGCITAALGGVGAAWALHLIGRSMPVCLSYFVIVYVLVFVIVDEHLIWYKCIYLVMSLLQHLWTCWLAVDRV